MFSPFMTCCLMMKKSLKVELVFHVKESKSRTHSGIIE